MGRAIIGGVITSTILTLVVVPVLYSYLVRERRPRTGDAGQAVYTIRSGIVRFEREDAGPPGAREDRDGGVARGHVR